MNQFIRGAAIGLALAAGFASPLAAKTLVFCSEGSPEGFNPQLYSSGTTFDASSRQVYNRLMEFELGTTELKPALAESVDVSEDGLVYTFKLRPGVKWQTTRSFTPTRDLNADDVVFTFMRQLDPNHPYHEVSGGNYGYFTSKGFDTLLKSVEKVDDMTVRITLNSFSAAFMPSMGMDFASILSAEYADKMMEAGTPEKVDLEPVGTGPFQLMQYQKDAVVRFKAHPDYWRGKAPIDTLVFSITPDAAVRYQKLLAGECHVMTYPNPADLPAMRQNPDLRVESANGLNIGYLAMNTGMEPFDDKRVRQAVNMAIDKQTIIDVVYPGIGTVAKNPYPPEIWSYNDAVQDYPYDPEAAKALLAEAGYPNGFTTDLWAMPVQRPYNPDAKRIAELMQADLAKVGITANIVTMEWGEYLNRTKNHEHQTAQLGWTTDNGDPDNFLYELLSCASAAPGGNNIAKWCHPEFDALITQAKQSPDQAERTRLYEQAQVIFKEEAPWVTIAHSVANKPVRKEVKNFKVDLFGGHVFYGVDLE